MIELVTLTLVSLLLAADGNTPNTTTTVAAALNGKPKADVIRLLGPPQKTKSTKGGGKILFYDGPVLALLDPTAIDPVTGQASTTQSRQVGGVTVTSTVASPSPVSSGTTVGKDGTPGEPLEPNLDAAGKPLGSVIYDTGQPVGKKIRIYLDAAGNVTQIKVGRRVLE
ncbi:MAG: hypothetical protein GY716_19745 [bacterium]|nr:hypothetical protein [bacterium]